MQKTKNGIGRLISRIGYCAVFNDWWLSCWLCVNVRWIAEARDERQSLLALGSVKMKSNVGNEENSFIFIDRILQHCCQFRSVQIVTNQGQSLSVLLLSRLSDEWDNLFMILLNELYDFQYHGLSLHCTAFDHFPMMISIDVERIHRWQSNWSFWITSEVNVCLC